MSLFSYRKKKNIFKRNTLNDNTFNMHSKSNFKSTYEYAISINRKKARLLVLRINRLVNEREVMLDTAISGEGKNEWIREV